MSDVDQVRSFHRLVTKRAGVLEESYLSRGRPLSEARLLFEIGDDGAKSRALRERLGLDSGYLTRLVASLEKQGCVESAPLAGDARRRALRLTELGREERDAYDALSDELARKILAPLSASQRRRLVDAMAEVERGLRAGEVRIAPEDPASEDARACLIAYFAELAERFEGGFDARSAGAQPGEDFLKTGGCFVLARLDGQAIGCGGFVAHDAETAEIKRVWTSSAARGLGVARAVLAALEKEAKLRGFRRLILDTNKALKEAQAMYLALGYHDIERYNDNPYAHRWFAKEI